MFRRDDDSVGLSGWLYSDLLLGLLVIFLAVGAVGFAGRDSLNKEKEEFRVEVEELKKGDQALREKINGLKEDAAGAVSDLESQLELSKNNHDDLLKKYDVAKKNAEAVPDLENQLAQSRKKYAHLQECVAGSDLKVDQLRLERKDFEKYLEKKGDMKWILSSKVYREIRKAEEHRGDWDTPELRSAFNNRTNITLFDYLNQLKNKEKNSRIGMVETFSYSVNFSKNINNSLEAFFKKQDYIELVAWEDHDRDQKFWELKRGDYDSRSTTRGFGERKDRVNVNIYLISVCDESGADALNVGLSTND